MSLSNCRLQPTAARFCSPRRLRRALAPEMKGEAKGPA
jgi:hypothetical protein